MMKLLLVLGICIFLRSDVIRAAFSSHERAWLDSNPSVTNHHESQQKAAKKAEFESHGYTDVNLFRLFYKFSQENSPNSWQDFANSPAFRDYHTRQNLVQSLIASGFVDPKWHSSFFKWSSTSNSVDINSWTHSEDYATTQTYLAKRSECIAKGLTEYEFGYYYLWYQNHINDAVNDVNHWKSSLEFREMHIREQKRTELIAAGYEDVFWFRSYYDFWKKHPTKSLTDWEQSYDHLLLKYRESKRTELIAHGYHDKAQFNEFWKWFQMSPAYIDPASPYVTSTDRGFPNKWDARQLATSAGVTHAVCRCVTADSSKGLSICHRGCGNPDKVCDNNFGCSDIQKSCDNTRCTCQPYNITAERKYTFTQCEQQCSRLGMQVPFNKDSLKATDGTGCNGNTANVWINPFNEPVVPTPAPSQRPATQRYTIDEGMQRAWADTKTARYSTEKASCRCVNSDISKGLSICLAGCGMDENTGHCDNSYGCTKGSCSDTTCMCKPHPSITERDMTYDQCQTECARADMVIPYNEAGVVKSQNTGCGHNGKRIWIDYTPTSS